MASIKNIERSPKVATFMRNVGKSFKIIASDVLEKENLIPQARKQFKTYNDYFNEIKIRRNEKRDLIMSSRQLNRTKIYDSSNKFMERAWDELKSNPIYEKEREDYFEDEEEKEVSSSDLNESIQNSGKATSTMIGQVGEYIINNMRISNNLQRNSNLKLLNAVTSGFEITNNYLDKIASNTSQLNSHMSNSMTFYENMLSLQKQSVDIQIAMYDMQNAINSKSGYTANTQFDRVFNKDKGNFDFREYIKEVGTNMATMLSSNNPTSGLMYKIVSPILSTDLAKLKTNPIETILSLSTRLAIRNISAVEGLVKTVSEGIDNFFPNLIGKIANLSSSDNPIIKKIMSNPIAAKILPMLGIKVEEKTEIDPSKFDKGPVPFDGVTRRTIVKTIPEYLARIESALTGKEERYMDNISGKWIKKSQVKARNQEIKDIGFKTGTKGIRDQIQDYLTSNGMTDQVYTDITDAFLRKMYNKGGMFIQNISAGGTDRETLYRIARQKGLPASEAQKILKALDSEAVRNKARSSFFDFNKGKNEENKIIASEEAKGYDLLSQEFDNSNMMAEGGNVPGKRGEPTLAIMTAGEKVVNTFGPKETEENIQKENAFARKLGLDVPQYAAGTTANPIRKIKNFATNAYGKVKEKGSELLETLKSNDMADLVMEFAPNADKQKVQTVLNKTATAIPRGLKGAGIGGIIGFLTGMPLIGMAVGSGVGIASVSDTVKGFLFGKEMEDGTYKDGVIPKSWTDFAKKSLPNAKIGGIIGGIAGLLTGGIGILPAAVIGAGAGVALSSNKVKEFLFGKTNENGEFEDTGIIKKKVQDYVKAKAPGMALGAVGGVVSTLLGAGPFGLLGNAVLGAGTSLLVTSDKFKDFMLGKEDENGKRSGGLLGDLKLRVLDPLAEAGKELLEEGRKFFRVNVFDNVKKFLGTASGLITNTIADFRYMLANMVSNGSVPIDETLGSYTRGAINFGKKVLTAPVRAAAAVATLPFRALGGISNKITDRMISRGNASNMSAQERLNYRRTRKGKLAKYSDSYAEADKTLANASVEDLRKLYVVSNLGGPNIEGFTETAADAIHRFTDFILKNREQILIKEKSLRMLLKDMAHGDSEAFSKHLNSLKELNSIQKSKIYDAVDNDLVALQELRDKQGNLRASQSKSMEYIKKTFGIKGKFGRLQLGRFNRSLEKEIGVREAAEKAEEDKTNIIDPNGNQYENAFRNVVSEKLDKLISLLDEEVKNTNATKEAAQKTVEEQKTLAGQAGLTRDENGNLSVRKNATASSSRSRFNIRNSITKLREDIRNNRRTMKNHIKLGFSYGWGASRYLMQNGINLGNLDPALIRTLKKLNIKISSKDTATLEYIIKSENRDKLLELINIIKTKGLFDLKSNDVITLDEYIEKNRGNYGNVLDFFTLVFKKGGYRLGSSEDLTAILDKCQIDNTGLSNLTQNLKYVKFTGQNADPEFIARTTHEIIEFNDKKQASGDYDRVNRFSGKLLRTGKKLTKAGQTILKFGRNVMFGKDEKSDNVSSLFDFVKNYGVMGGLRALMLGDETQTKSKFLKNGGLFGAIKGGAKNVVGFFFGKDKNGETIFQRHGLLGYIPAAIFGDDKSPGLLGNTLLGKGVKIFGKILKGLLIAAVAAPIVGQAVHFFKTTLKPIWGTVIQPWWNEHITQPLTERWNKAKIALFGEKKVRDEDGEEYYEGGLLSGPLNAVRKPIGKIRDFFNGLKAKWQEAEEKSGSKTIGGVLKYFLTGDGKLVTRGSDGLWSSNNSLIGNALKFILNGYKYVAKDIVTPVTDFFKKTVLPWIENTAAPWLSGLLQTLFNNYILHPFNEDKQWKNFDSKSLISRGGGTPNTGGGDTNENYTYNPSSGKVTDTGGNEITGDVKDNIVGEIDYNNSKIQRPDFGGFIEKNDSISITVQNDYYDYYINKIYHITGRYQQPRGIFGSKTKNIDQYYRKEGNQYLVAIPVNFVGSNPYNKLANYGLKLSKTYNGKPVFYCSNNETYYIPSSDNTHLEEIMISDENALTNNNIINNGGRSRNHIYQNDPKIRNTRFGKSTIGDAGCGPVAAANLMGGALGYATDYAQKGGFVNNDGSTSINYFTSMFNGKNTTSKEEVKDRLKKNKPVVLLGKDESNGVYGSNNHFVTAKGYDKSGNVIVEDPDLPQSSMRYPAKKVFKGMKAASIIGGKRRQDNRLVNFEDTEDNKPVVKKTRGIKTDNKFIESTEDNKPVVLLGKDESNGVYGSNNHFVTAKGYDKSGNVIVEDPDLPQSSMRYPAKKVFKGMKAASIIGGRSREKAEENIETINRTNAYNKAMGLPEVKSIKDIEDQNYDKNPTNPIYFQNNNINEENISKPTKKKKKDDKKFISIEGDEASPNILGTKKNSIAPILDTINNTASNSSYNTDSYNYDTGSTVDYSNTSSTDTGESSETTNTISSIFTKLGNLASLIFKKTFGITWDDVSGNTSSTEPTGNSGVFDSGSSLSDGGTESKSFTIKGNQRTRFVEIAKTQVGYKEGSNNNTKYGAWYGANNNAWCVMFVCWCAQQAGITTSVIPKTASTTSMCNWFDKNDRLHLRTSMYIPLPGDIVFFTGNRSKSGLKHTGIVEGINGTTLITIEGNYSDKVTRREYKNFINNSNIYAFASPNFADDNRTITVEGYGSKSIYSAEDSNGGVEYDANDEKQKIWKFLRNKAGLSPVGASGLFGAWEAESGLKPKRVEYDYSKKFPGYEAMNNHSVMNDFTKNVLFKQYDSQGLSYNANAYYGSDKNLYPGLGLAQWTGPRGQSLYEYTRNNGYGSIFNTDAQLNYAKSEFDKSYPSLIGKLNNAATPEDAAKVALDGYEMYNGFADKRPDILAPRAKNARAYYEKYKGLGRDDTEEVFNNPIAYGPEKVVTAQTRDEGSYVSYDEYLETIVKILLTISDNTNAVNTILDIMSKEGANLSAKAREDISKAVSSSNSIQNLKDSLKNSMAGRSTGISSMIGNSRTDLIIKTMKEIAAQ